MPDDKKPVSQVLEEAVEVLDNEDWTKGFLHNDMPQSDTYGGYCLVGSIGRVLGYEMHNNLAFIPGLAGDVPEQTICKTAGEDLWDDLKKAAGGKPPIGYNDQASTTREDVQDLMMKVAKFYRDKGL